MSRLLPYRFGARNLRSLLILSCGCLFILSLRYRSTPPTNDPIPNFGTGGPSMLKSSLVSDSLRTSVLAMASSRVSFTSMDPYGDSWRRVTLNESTVHLYSAFLDQRQSSAMTIKINLAAPMSIQPVASKWHCVLERSNGSLISTGLEVTQLKEHFGLPFRSFFIDCKLGGVPKPQDFNRVVLRHGSGTNEPIKDKECPLKIVAPPEYSPEIADKMVVCVKPFHYNWDRALWLVEFIETYKLLGASHFVFYNHSVGPLVDKLLKKYVQEHVVTVLEWNLLLRSQKDIRTEAIFTALNDCNLRAVNRFKFAVVLDVDEYIFPRKHGFNLLEMVQNLTRVNVQVGSLVAKNAFFYLYWENDTQSLTGHNSLLHRDHNQSHVLPYLLTQTKTRRIRYLKRHGQRSKYVCLPRRAILLGNHNVWTHSPGDETAFGLQYL